MATTHAHTSFLPSACVSQISTLPIASHIATTRAMNVMTRPVACDMSKTGCTPRQIPVSVLNKILGQLGRPLTRHACAHCKWSRIRSFPDHYVLMRSSAFGRSRRFPRHGKILIGGCCSSIRGTKVDKTHTRYLRKKLPVTLR